MEELRRLGHDVLTSFEAGNANLAIPDEGVLALAASGSGFCSLIAGSHFLRLHQRSVSHAGIVVCTYDRDFTRQARRIHDALSALREGSNRTGSA